GHRVGHVLRLVGIERAGQAGAHVTERAGAGAGVAHDHEGGVLLLPALPDIRATRFLADGVQPVLADDAARLGIAARHGRLGAGPVRLAEDGAVRPARLLGMARAYGVDNDDHGNSERAKTPAIYLRSRTGARKAAAAWRSVVGGGDRPTRPSPARRARPRGS